MNILGVSFDYHDAAAALLCDGEIVAAAQEERFSRKKNDQSIPVSAVQHCLATGGIQADRLDKVVFYEWPLLKFDRILSGSIRNIGRSSEFLKSAVRLWLRQGKFWPQERIATSLNVPLRKVTCVRHHDAHSAAAFYNSPFDEAAIITLDGVGEYETGTIARGGNDGIRKLKSINLPHSIGLFYSAITAYLGFKVNEDEYKVMGMAGFGRPEFYDVLRQCFELKADGTFRLSQEMFDFYCSTSVPYTRRLVDTLGAPREPESRFSLHPTSEVDQDAAERCRHHANVAASAQKVTEEVIFHVAKHAMHACGSRNVCLGGGVALNSLANGKIRKELGCNLYIHPGSGDCGGALGAAQWYWHMISGQPKQLTSPNPYLGCSYGKEDVQKAIRAARLSRVERFEDESQLLQRVALALRDGKVVGWLHGRFEWGPRALGCRSILANATIAEMQYIVNTKIKFREPFRPFGPAVLQEKAAEYFEVPGQISDRDPESYMLAVCMVREEKKAIIPAVTHVDGTARVQLVNRTWNPRYYELIRVFGEVTGVPVIMNTSFNLRGEPIVNSPADAVKTFEWSGLDCLVLEEHFIEKE